MHVRVPISENPACSVALEPSVPIGLTVLRKQIHEKAQKTLNEKSVCIFRLLNGLAVFSETGGFFLFTPSLPVAIILAASISNSCIFLLLEIESGPQALPLEPRQSFCF